MRTVPTCCNTLPFSHRWAECQDVFDEESCRYFLNEVGKRIVPCYPFAFGIEEVYGMITERYGLDQAADVMSILQELLEDDCNASGFGDDGDIWRSWRHSWRHRNDDATHPFIPRVRNLILRPPTSIHLRRLKAENFLRQQRLSHRSMTSASGEISHDTIFGSVLSAVDNRTPSPFSPRTFEHDGIANCIGTGCTGESFDPPQSLRRSVPVVSFHSLSQFPTPPSTIGTSQGLRQCVAGSADNARQAVSVTRSASEGCTRLPSHNPAPGSRSVHDHASKLRSSIEKCGNENGSTSSRVVVQETARPQEVATTQQETRLENRQARLIDGKIFMFRNKTSKTSISDLTETHAAAPTEVRSISSKRNCIPIRSHLLSRRSWFRGLRHVFFRPTTINVPTSQPKHLSLPAPLSTNLLEGGIDPLTRSTEQHTASNIKPSRHFGFDGALDWHTSGAEFFMDLNKPLPLRPAGMPFVSQQRASPSSPASFPEFAKLPSTASTTSSNLSTKSSRADFHGITRELMQPTSVTILDLPPIEERGTVKSYADPSTPKSWRTMSVRDSTHDQPAYRPPALPPAPLDLNRMRITAKSENTNSMPYSQSAPVLKSQPQTSSGKEIDFQTQTQELENRDRKPDPTIEKFEVRGRSPAICKPNGQAISNETTPKRKNGDRSRSPIKKLLAFGKHEVSIESQEQRVPLPKTPASTKKSSIKRWGEKIRYGFLTPDDEQLRNEDLIEKHMDADTPPSGNSSFPVSLEPPTQAKLQSEIELYVTVTANRFLMKEARAGRLSAESVSKLKDRWVRLNRPQVVEFHYDQMYQHDLVYANIQNVKFYGDAAKDLTQVQSTLDGWRVMAREMSVRTLCSPDSVLRKHLHDAHRVLELLGAPFVTFLAYENMQIKSLQMISQRQRERMDAKLSNKGHTRSFSDGVRIPSDNNTIYEPEYTAESFQLDKIRLSPSPSPAFRREPRKATGAEGAIMSLPLPPSRMRVRPSDRVQDHFDRSKGGRLGKAIHEKPENLLL